MEQTLDLGIQRLLPLINSGLLSEEDAVSLISVLERMVVSGDPALVRRVWNIFEKMASVKSTTLRGEVSRVSESSVDDWSNFKGKEVAAAAFKKEYRNLTYKKLLDEQLALHEKNSHDYAADSNPYSNFESAAAFAHVTVDQVFEVLLGIKYARLWELIRSGKTPNHESIEDTMIDISIYSNLRISYRRDHSRVKDNG